MVIQKHVEGLEAFQKAAEENKDKTLFALFSGTPVDGKNWCPDCETADPVVAEGLKEAPADAVFIHCGVGGRDFWKDQNNVFRKDPILKLKSVPTLLRLHTPQRLEEAKCANAELVKMFFADD